MSSTIPGGWVGVWECMYVLGRWTASRRRASGMATRIPMLIWCPASGRDGADLGAGGPQRRCFYPGSQIINNMNNLWWVVDPLSISNPGSSRCIWYRFQLTYQASIGWFITMFRCLFLSINVYFLVLGGCKFGKQWDNQGIIMNHITLAIVVNIWVSWRVNRVISFVNRVGFWTRRNGSSSCDALRSYYVHISYYRKPQNQLGSRVSKTPMLQFQKECNDPCSESDSCVLHRWYMEKRLT